MDILESHNVPLSRFIWVHAQRGSAEANIAAAQKGAWVSLDNVNASRDSKPDARFGSNWYVHRLDQLKDAGCLHRVLISHDAGWYRPGEPQGGRVRGFTDLFTSLVPRLLETGFTEDEIEQLLVSNPRVACSIFV
jgi:phosphotriesterase-related protein